MATTADIALKVAVLLGLLSVCVRADYDPKDGRHNITMGHRRVHPQYPLDTLLFHDSPKLDGSWFPYPKVKSNDECYPPKGSHPAKFTITAFNVTDLIPNGDGGLAFIKEGGIASGKLCLHLKTQRGKGYHFNIDIWGYNI